MSPPLRPSASSALLNRSVSQTVDEEVRQFLQDRVRLLSKVTRILGGAFYVLPLVIVAMGDSVDQAMANAVASANVIHFALVASFGLAWGVTSRVRLSYPALRMLDAAGPFVCAAAIAGLAAAFSTGPLGGHTLALGLGHLVVLRAIVVPSSGRRTFWLTVASASLGTLLFASAALLMPQRSPLEAEVAHFHTFVNLALWLTFATAVATIGSHVIFGLREEVRKARRIGQYDVQRRLGEGGMGVVFQATHAMLRRATAIKLLSPTKGAQNTIARFEREVQQTARLVHPNTVAIYDYGRTPNGMFYYAMEYLDGVDLQRLVERGGPIPPGRVVHILAQVLASLAEAHGIGLIHRDIKPANIMLTSRGGESDIVKVLDFGLVKQIEGRDDVALTSTRGLTGTPLYLAPEAIHAPQTVGPPSDLYAVAAVGYFLLTGTEVFSGSTVVEVCAHHLHSIPEPPASRRGEPVPPGLSSVILSGLAKNPSERPPDARHFRQSLLSCDAPVWTEQDARQWWDTTGARMREDRDKEAKHTSQDTVLIDLDARSPGA
jgi:serine/threonine-protein kinase